MLHHDTITVFNGYYSRIDGTTWYPSVVHGVHLDIDKAANIAKYKVETEDVATASIPYTVEDGKKIISGKEWKSPNEWEKQVNDDMRNTITFSMKNQTPDFYWFGEWEGSDPIRDDEYGGNFYQYMKANYDYVFAITSVGANYTVIPHVEIAGK